MTLEGLWYGLFVAVIAAYLVLDGFDLGVGMLHPFVARTDEERRISLNSIGPIWDGNEVWLVVGGGVLFGAFPVVYASLFSGFYLALMLVLLFLILRTVSIEFRSKRDSPRWRATWDVLFSLSSYALAVLLGVAFGNVITGVPLNEHGQVHASLIDLLKPFPVWVGLTTVAMLLMHGSLYLRLKTDDPMQARAVRWSPRFIAAFAAMGIVTVVWTYLDDHGLSANYDNIWPLIFPVAAALAFITLDRQPPSRPRGPSVLRVIRHARDGPRVGGDRALPEHAEVHDRPLVLDDDLERICGERDADGHAGRRDHRAALRADLHGGGPVPVPRQGPAGLR